jgi:hypothetical protein
VLTKAGYTHWYWGFALQYMHDYDAYGGKELSRKEFYEILGKEASCVRKFDPVDVVASGRAVISSTL